MQVVENNSVAAPAVVRTSLSLSVIVALWFGVLGGFVEGLGLLLFQRINWARWGATIHVSEPIVWISMLVDVGFFVVLAVVLRGIGKLIPGFRVLRNLIFLLVFLVAYDWLSVTGRLKVMSCALLAGGIAAVVSRWISNRESNAVSFWRRTAPWLAATAILIYAGIEGGQWFNERAEMRKLPAARAQAPNVLVIVVDTLRADHLSAYGYGRETSPNINRLAEQGTLFQNAVSAGSWSLPSHASMLTGRYQFEHGIGDVDGTPIRDSATPAMGGYTTLGEALEQRGYRTGAFSANRSYFSANLGFDKGFTHFEDYFHSNADRFVRTFYGGQLAGLYLNATRNAMVAKVLRAIGCEALLDASFEGPGGLSGAHVRKRADTVNREVLNWIDDDGKERPFFAFLNYFDVHNPYGGPPNYPKPAWEQSSVVDRYDDSVKYIDDAVGQLLGELERRGVADKTLVILTSDHGESLGQHGLAYHGHSLYRELIHVPLILSYPGHVPAGLRVVSPVNNASIPATVMGVVGAESGGGFPGQPLNAYWEPDLKPKESAGQLSELALEHFLEPEDEGADKLIPLGTTGPMKSVIGDQWHLIIHKRFGNQLYDWVHDPGESHNVIHTPEGEAISGRLLAAMHNALAGESIDPRTVAVSLQSEGQGVVEGSRLSSPVNEYFHFQVEAGAMMKVNVMPEQGTGSGVMDPVVTITDPDGQPLEACRDPEDDRVQAPAAADPTPEAFDDVCINDDISPGVQTDSQLEILVPGKGHSPVELYVRVSDWNGRVGPGLKYKIAVSGPDFTPALNTAKR